jgi:hypothetical protein
LLNFSAGKNQSLFAIVIELTAVEFAFTLKKIFH